MANKIVLNSEDQEQALGAVLNLGEEGVSAFAKMAGALKEITSNTPSFNNLLESFGETEKTFNRVVEKSTATTDHIKRTIEVTENMEKASYSSVVEEEKMEFDSHKTNGVMGLI